MSIRPGAWPGATTIGWWCYLAQLPVESLKIDRSFIIKTQEDPNAMTLVSTIISLAHSLLLRCDEFQGTE